MKQIITTIVIMLTMTITVTAQHKILGNVEVYGTIKAQGIGAKSSADTLVMFNQADSVFYKIAVSDLSISSNSLTYSPWNTFSDGQGDMIVNNIDSADRVYIRHYANFDPQSPTSTNAFIAFQPFQGILQIYPSDTYNLGGASIRLLDFSVRTDYSDNLYLGRDGQNTTNKRNYITATRDGQTVFELDTVGNVTMSGALRLKDSWKTTITPQLGDMYFDNSDSTLRIYTGNQYETVNTTP